MIDTEQNKVVTRCPLINLSMQQCRTKHLFFNVKVVATVPFSSRRVALMIRWLFGGGLSKYSRLNNIWPVATSHGYVTLNVVALSLHDRWGTWACAACSCVVQRVEVMQPALDWKKKKSYYIKYTCLVCLSGISDAASCSVHRVELLVFNF